MKKARVSQIFLFTVVITAIFGAGIVDIVFPDVVPVRPYSSFFRFAPVEMLGRASVMGDILIVTAIIVLVAAMVVAVANRTTGIIIFHTGGPTVNTNLTGTPGLSGIFPLFPLFLAFIGLVIVAKHMKGDAGGI